MTEQEVKEIYSRLLESTKSGLIQWKKTGEAEYAVNFSRSSVFVEKDYERVYDAASEAQSVLKIFNEDGLLIINSPSACCGVAE